MAVSPAPPWLPMIRVYLLYRIVTLSFTLKTLCLVIAYAITSTAASALAEDSSLNSCDNQDFDNAYYLLDKNDINDVPDFFRQIVLLFSAEKTNFLTLMGQRDRITTYYDFDNLELHNANKELVHTLDINLPDYRVEKEQISYIDKQTTPATIKRFEVKNYNRKISPLDKHQFFSRIKRKVRPILIDQLSTNSKDSPETISESLKIKSIEKVGLITLFGIPHAAITLSKFTISDIGVPNTSMLIKIEIFHDSQDKLIKQEKKYLNSLFCRIDENFHSRFPHIKSYSWFGYVEYNKLATNFQPSRALFRQYPEIYSIGQILCLTFIGFLLIYLILGRYSRQASYGKISKTNYHQ